MRKYAILLIAALLLLLPSCQSIEPMEEDEYEYPDAGMFPQRYIPVTSLEDFDNDHLVILGMVEGFGDVSADNPKDGDTGAYGTLENQEDARMYYTPDAFDARDPGAVAMANAVSEMIENAREKGAAFLTFPSYTIQTQDGRVKARATAIAVGLIEPVEEPAAE